MTFDIYRSGRVVEMLGDAKKELAPLSDPVISKIASLAELIQPGELIDREQGQPQCLDAPAEQYVLYPETSNMEFAAWRGCHHFVLNSPAASKLKTIVEGLVAQNN
jgi:hypothetical protein